MNKQKKWRPTKYSPLICVHFNIQSPWEHFIDSFWSWDHAMCIYTSSNSLIIQQKRPNGVPPRLLVIAAQAAKFRLNRKATPIFGDSRSPWATLQLFFFPKRAARCCHAISDQSGQRSNRQWPSELISDLVSAWLTARMLLNCEIRDSLLSLRTARFAVVLPLGRMPHVGPKPKAISCPISKRECK